jgi:nicotinamidase-related amidase
LRFIFVDAENIGLKGVEAIDASISDKVIVFSKNEAVKEACERKLFLYVSSYPSGPNQADFYVIGNLIGIIASLSEVQRSACQFILYTQDNALTTAFSFQCKLHKVNSKIALKPKSDVQQKRIVEPKKLLQSLEQMIYDQLKTAQTTEAVRKKLKQPKPEFTKALNQLIRAEKIRRVSKNKKTWIQA